MRQSGALLIQEARWNEAEAVLKDALDSSSNDAATYIQLCWLSYYRGDGVDAALSVLRKAINLYPETGELYYHAGLLTSREGRYDEAEVWLRQAVDRNPEHSDWYLTLANIWRYRGDFDRAAQAYRQVIERFPNYAPAYFELAWAYKQLDQPEDALNVLEQTSSLAQPSNPVYYLRAGDIYEWTGHDDLARHYYELVLKVDPENQDARLSIERVENGTP